MKKIKLPFLIMLVILSYLLKSCSSVSEIYSSGMGYGIFTALAVLVIIAFLFMKAKNRNK